MRCRGQSTDVFGLESPLLSQMLYRFQGFQTLEIELRQDIFSVRLRLRFQSLVCCVSCVINLLLGTFPSNLSALRNWTSAPSLLQAPTYVLCCGIPPRLPLSHDMQLPNGLLCSRHCRNALRNRITDDLPDAVLCLIL